MALQLFRSKESTGEPSVHGAGDRKPEPTVNDQKHKELTGGYEPEGSMSAARLL
jgi:hypothetical protein